MKYEDKWPEIEHEKVSLFHFVHFLSVSTCLSLTCLSPPVSLSTCLSPPVFLHVSLHLSVSTCLSLTCSLHLSLSTCLSPPVSLLLSLSSCLSPPVSLHLSVSTCLSPPVSLHLSLSTCLSLHLLQGHMLEVCPLTGKSHLSHVFLSAQTFTASQLHTDSAAMTQSDDFLFHPPAVYMILILMMRSLNLPETKR
ncbi:hypothetical protein F7725_016331, partial [Dissostichus mawsoni]